MMDQRLKIEISKFLSSLAREGLSRATLKFGGYKVEFRPGELKFSEEGKDTSFREKSKIHITTARERKNKKVLAKHLPLVIAVLFIGLVFIIGVLILTPSSSSTVHSSQRNEEMELIEALKNHQVKKAKMLLQNIERIVNVKDEKGRTALHYAAEMGLREIVGMLLKKGASLNVKDIYGLTPLHLAAYNNKKDTVKLLVEAGAALDIKGGEHGWTPLHYCAERGHIEAASILLEAGADINEKDSTEGETPLHVAAEAGQEKFVEFLIKNGAYVNAKDWEKETPLHDAAYWGKLGVVKILIAHGAYLFAKDKDGKMPWQRAQDSDYIKDERLRKALVSILKGKKQQIKLPEQHFTGVEKPKKVSIDTLMKVVEAGNIKKVQEILKNKIDINNFDSKGRLPLTEAARAGNIEIVEILLKAEAEVNKKDKSSFTALHYSSRDGRFEIVKLLLEHGADPNIKESHGATPLHLAAYNKHLNIVKLLISKGAKVNVATTKYWKPWNAGSTPLHTAVWGGSVEVVKTLISAGADPEIEDSEGFSPYDLALRLGRKDMLSLLEVEVK